MLRAEYTLSDHIRAVVKCTVLYCLWNLPRELRQEDLLTQQVGSHSQNMETKRRNSKAVFPNKFSTLLKVYLKIAPGEILSLVEIISVLGALLFLCSA